MATQNLLNEKHITNAIVYIDGNETDFVSLSLEQSFGEHHRFTLVLDYEALKCDFINNPLKQIALIGKQTLFELRQGNDNANAYQFSGVISNVISEGQDGKHGHLIVEGFSPTIMLERGKRMDAFSDMTLRQVFEEVIDGVINNILYPVKNPEYTDRIAFLMQYRESDWEFLQRLSAISGEALFFTGRELVFGTYKDWEATEVMYDREISNIRFVSRLLPNTFSRYRYLADRHYNIEQKSIERIEGANEYVREAAERSRNLTEKRPVHTPVDLQVEDTGSLIDMVVRQKSATAAQSIFVQGIAKTCDPWIGRLLKISVPKNVSDAGELGTYRIVKVKHEIDQNHRYRCEFEGIPANLKYFPTPELKIPVVSSMQGTVTNNRDPQGLGRVRVEFPFAEDRPSEAWLQVMAPDAGSSEEVSKNRGMVFVPEEGDRVMVGFEFGDPNRPYVMGSMFHGKNTTGGGTGNNLKTIITKSGHTIEFDDNAASLGITIKDKKGNVIRLDSKGKNIEITAPETMTLNAKNMKINVDENLDVVVGKDATASIGGNQKTEVGETIETSTNKLATSIAEDANIAVEKKLTATAGDADLFTKSGDIVIKSAAKALVQGAADARVSKG
jgi:uncharacterized protein involved in type VI secretion and phage assembly